MPLLRIQQLDPHTQLGIWLITERSEELLASLPPHLDRTGLTAFSHPKRQQEWLASRLLIYRLLRLFTPEPLQLFRNEHGKPLLEGEGFHLSITHSSTLAAVILSDRYEVGIDVELLHPKVLRVADKFLQEMERTFTADDVYKTCLYWSAKETLYKLYSKKSLVLKDNLTITSSATGGNNVLQGSVRTDNFYRLYQIRHEILLNHVLTYSIDS